MVMVAVAVADGVVEEEEEVERERRRLRGQCLVLYLIYCEVPLRSPSIVAMDSSRGSVVQVTGFDVFVSKHYCPC